MDRPCSGLAQGWLCATLQVFAGQGEPILQPFPSSGSCCSMEMCPGKEQQGRKHRGAAEGRRIQLDVRSQKEPRVFQAEGLAGRSEFYLHTQGLVPDCSDGMAGHKAGNIDPCILQRWEELRPINPSHQARRVIALLTHTDSQWLCQFGCSPPVTQNAATPSLLSRAVSASQQPGQSQAPAPDDPSRPLCSCRAQLRLAGIPLWAVEQGMSSSRAGLILL